MSLRWLCLLPALLISLGTDLSAQVACASAQAACVRGIVRNFAGHPLAQAQVELVGTGRIVESTPSGQFVLDSVPGGPQTLAVRLIGFEPRQISIVVDPMRGWTGAIELRLAAVLPEIEVTARLDRPPEYVGVARYDDFFRRKRLGFGTFRTRADIEALGAHDVMGALRGIPGVRASMGVSPTGAPSANLRIARCPGSPPPLAVYIDGQRQYLPRSIGRAMVPSGMQSRCPECEALAEIFSSVSIRDIELVEFYRGTSQIPGDLDRTDNCAAIVIWTR